MAALRILVTNDDGVESPGIVALAEALRLLGDVTVVAPDADQSGVSHAISARRPLSVVGVDQRSVPTYACSGTPADCVILGTYELCGGRPDIVVSGINRGANLADDINYSGTVAAAIEAQLLEIPAIAVSLAANWPAFSEQHHWEVAARAALEAARRLMQEPLERGTFLNINAPNIEPAAVRGMRFTRQGRKRYEDRISRSGSAPTLLYHYSWEHVDWGLDDPESDLVAVRDGYVSVTPLAINRTNEAAFARLAAAESFVER